MPVVSISFPKNLLDKIDYMVSALGYTGRSELVRDAVRRLVDIVEVETRDKGKRLWIIIAVTDHSASPPVDRRVIEVVHDNQALIKAFYHQLLRDNLCLNIVVLEASLEELRKVLGDIRRIRGVSKTWFMPLDY